MDSKLEEESIKQMMQELGRSLSAMTSPILSYLLLFLETMIVVPFLAAFEVPADSFSVYFMIESNQGLPPAYPLMGLSVLGGALVASVKTFEKDEAAQAKTRANKAESKDMSIEKTKAAWSAAASSPVKKIVFACDAGIGSSAMGAAKLRKKIQAAGITGITVVHSPVNEMPVDADIVICHKELGARAQQANSKARLVTITDFLSAPEYEELIAGLKK
ncbi:MAG: hypothetical protein LBB43_03875 [Spirochaetaceae bacterium]|jgi:mannitol-specific phosphotransferase system IIBC component|nr:hypothetical protein [Spirochaetaceae bacterium]